VRSTTVIDLPVLTPRASPSLGASRHSHYGSRMTVARGRALLDWEFSPEARRIPRSPTTTILSRASNRVRKLGQRAHAVGRSCERQPPVRARPTRQDDRPASLSHQSCGRAASALWQTRSPATPSTVSPVLHAQRRRTPNTTTYPVLLSLRERTAYSSRSARGTPNVNRFTRHVNRFTRSVKSTSC
jgi:hypothetical protein